MFFMQYEIKMEWIKHCWHWNGFQNYDVMAKHSSPHWFLCYWCKNVSPGSLTVYCFKKGWGNIYCVNVDVQHLRTFDFDHVCSCMVVV